jgi:hypothetical protein
MTTQVCDEMRYVTIKDAEYVREFTRNLLSYVNLEKKEIRLSYDGAKRYLSKGGTRIVEATSEGSWWCVAN